MTLSWRCAKPGRTRLELLAQELQPVFAEVPEDHPLFDFAISNGENPRLWIDAIAHVTMGRDRRTYRFLRDTRMGRVVLAESTHAGEVADKVTRYIAERMVERERMIEGEVEDLPRHMVDGKGAGAARPGRARSRRRGLMTDSFWFCSVPSQVLRSWATPCPNRFPACRFSD